MLPAPPTLDETLAQTDWVRRLARSLVSDADADDLAQDAWVAALQHDGVSRGWFAGALRNLAAFRHRTTARRLRRDAAVEPREPEPSPDVVMERLEAQRQLATLVSALPEPTRTVVYLRFFEGLDATAIGARLRLPPGTVRWRLKQGLDALREQLDERLGGRSRWSALLLPLAAPDGAPLHLTGALLVKAKHLVTLAFVLLFLLLGALTWRWVSRSDLAQVDAATGPGATAALPQGNAPADQPVARSPLPAWRAQTEAPSRKVAGRVVLDGAPLAGALVTLTLDEQPSDAPPQERVSAADGTFDFGVQPALSLSVGAAAAGHASTFVVLDLRNPEVQPRPDALELVVAAGCPARLFGHVFDSGAGPIANAAVRPSRTLGARTDASGAYALCLPRGETELVVEAPGYGAMSTRVTLEGELQRDVVLTPEAFIDGVVVDAAQRPVADALVTARQRLWQNFDGARQAFSRTDALGRFSMSVAPGDYRLQATAEGTGSSAIQVVSALVGERTRAVTLVVKRGVRLRGVVVSEGKPVAGARVTAHTVATGRAVDAFSQRDGRFVLEGVPEGELVFTAEPWEVEQPRRLVVKVGTPDVTLQVKRMAAVRGVVTRQQKPVVGAKVSAASTLGDVNAVTDAQGHYALEGLGRGGHQVTASSDALGAFTVKTVSIKGTEQLELNLELENAAFIDGTLVDEKNQPLAGARVVWANARNDEGASTTDARGHFHAAKLTGGSSYSPRVYLSGQVSGVEAKPVGAFPKVKLEDGDAKAENVRLQVKVETLSLAGRVVDAQGAPVADARVRAKPSNNDTTFSPFLALPQVFTDAQGRFAFEGLSSGTWAVQARSPRGEESIAKVEAGNREVVITLHPTATIEGTLVGYANTPVVYASRGRQLIAGQVTGASVHLVLTAGDWVITAMDNTEGDVQRVTLKEGETRPLTLRSHGTGKISGRVVDFETGLPVPNVMCRAMLVAGDTPGVTNWDPATVPMSDEEGRFGFEVAPAGHVMVGCLDDDVQSGATVFAELPSGGSVELDVKVVLRRDATPSAHGVELYSLSMAVTGVAPESPAAQAGVQVGDVLFAVDGKVLTGLGPQGAATLLDNRPLGATVSLGVQRAGRPLTVMLSLPR